jgi:hypothetical protein
MLPVDDLTAIVVTPSAKKIRGSFVTHNYVTKLSTAAELYEHRMLSIQEVKTRYAFFLDPDDVLPADFDTVAVAVVGQLARGFGLVYTDEIVQRADEVFIRRSEEFSTRNMLMNPLAINHLAAFDVQKARRVMKKFPPSGIYRLEFMLFYTLGRQFGAKYLPLVGYVYNQKETGMHTRPDTMQAIGNSMAWCVQS